MTETTMLADGLAMGESPRWHDGRLWVCDWAAGEVLTVDDAGNRQVMRTMAGLPFSIDWLPDRRLVITSGSARQVWAEQADGSLAAFDIAPDGGLSNRRVWADLGDAAPDGICLDAEGAVWYADVPHQRCVRVREGGEVLQTIEADRGCFACMLGGDDGRTLFIVATKWDPAAMSVEGGRTGQVLTARVDAPHAGRP